MPPDRSSVGRILVVTLSNLGDVVLSLPVFEALSAAYPQARIDAAVGAGGRVALEGHPRISEIVDYPRKAGLSGRWAMIRRVRAARYDLIIDLRYSLIGVLGGARWRNRYLWRGARPLHRGSRHLAALDGLLGRSAVPSKALPGRLAVSSPPEHAELIGAGRYVVAAPGSKSDLKKWAPEKFARVLDKLSINEGLRVVLVGDAADRESAQAVRRSMGAPCADLCGRTDYAGLRSVIAGASLVLTNDSAPLHLAESAGVPSVAIFGPTDPRKYGPRSHGEAVWRGLFCSPCEKAQCRYGHECMDRVSADEVYARAGALLAGREKRTGPRVLLVRLDRIGDLVLSLPAVRAIRERHPRAWIALLVRPSLRPLIEGHPDIDEVIPYEYEGRGRHSGLGNFRLIDELRRKDFDTAYVLHPSNRSVLVPWLAGIPDRVGLKAGPYAFLTRTVADRRHLGGRHEAEMTLDVVRADIAVPEGVLTPRLIVDEDEALRLKRRLGSWVGPETPIIALHPGASCPSKRWPAERFAELASDLLETTTANLVVVGGAEERALGSLIEKKVARPGRLMDLSGQLGLRELAALLHRACALVSNDSGPVHIAAAVGTPVVSIFGRNQPGLGSPRWAPLGAGHAVVRKDVGCVVCLAHRCPIEFECLRRIGVGEVRSALEKVLTAPEAATR